MEKTTENQRFVHQNALILAKIDSRVMKRRNISRLVQKQKKEEVRKNFLFVR